MVSGNMRGWVIGFLVLASAHGQVGPGSRLEPSSQVDQALRAGETHAYLLESRGGQYLDLDAYQDGIDLVAVLLSPTGAKVLEVDSPNGVRGSERVRTLLETPGVYRLEVRAPEKQEPGRYRINIREWRAATPADAPRLAGWKTWAEADVARREANLASREKAITLFRTAIALFKTAGDVAGEADAQMGIGRVLFNLGRNRDAIVTYEEALALYRRLGDRRNEAFTLNNIAVALDNLGERPAALERHKQALEIHRAVGNRAAEAQSLSSIGSVYDSMDDKDTALRYYLQALPIRRELKERRGEAATLHNMGSLYLDIHEYRTAIGYFEQAMALHRADNNKAGEAVTSNQLGVAYDNLGDFQKAIDSYRRALALHRAAGSRIREGVALNNLGFIHQRLGEHREALDWFEQALVPLRAAGEKATEPNVLDNMGKSYLLLGERAKALEAFTRALEGHRRIGRKRGEATVLHNLGRLYEEDKNPVRALEHYQQALALHRQVNDRREEANTLYSIAHVQEGAGDAAQARENLAQALGLARQIGDPVGEIKALHALSRLDYKAGKFTEARQTLERALTLIEAVRSAIASQALRTSYFATVQNVYELYTSVLMALARSNPALTPLAFEAAEARKARSLLEILAEARAGIRRGIDPELAAEERRVQESLNAREQRRLQYLAPEPAKAKALEPEIRALTAELEEVRARIRARHPRFAALTQPRGVRAGEARELLDGQTLLLEYSLGSERSFVWAVTRETIEGFELPGRAQIEELARPLHAWLSASTRTPAPPALAGLSRLLLGPVAARLGERRLLVVADGALEYLPFAALADPARPAQPLGARHVVAHLPSVSTVALLRAEPATAAAASTPEVAILADPVFASDDARLARPGDPGKASADVVLERAISGAGLSGPRIPRLPGTRREAAAIAAALPAGRSHVLAGFDANREAFRRPEVTRAGILHVATHGLLNTTQPELSGLILSLVDQAGAPRNGFLRLHEIFDLELAAKLVVLSACQTGLGKEIRGEGLVGLTRGFMYAGSPRVVASLWKVDDRATAELMRHFYQAMAGARPLTPAAALQAAQRKLRESGVWSDPYYWAAFILQGEWR